MKHPSKRFRGMTLIEIVVSMAIIAFVIPVILTVTAASAKSRMHAEADTQSSWIAQEIISQIRANWKSPSGESFFDDSISYPNFSTAESPTILAFDTKGKFVSGQEHLSIDGLVHNPATSYLVSVYGEAYKPPIYDSQIKSGSLIHLAIHYPARSKPANRSVFEYQVLILREDKL